MNKSFHSTKDKSLISSRKPHKIQISHRAVMRAQTSIRSAKQTGRIYRTTPSRNEAPPPIPSYLSKNTKKEPLKPMKSQSLLNDQELIDLRESLYKNCDLSQIKTDKLNVLSGHLREYTQFCGLQRRYPEAKQANQLYKAITSELSKRAVIPVDLSKELDSFEIKKEEEMDRLTLEIIEFDDETEQKREQLKQKQQQEYNEFQKQWKKTIPDRYRKISPKLLSLMTREKKCARCGEFDKAEILKKEVDQQMQIEMEFAQSQLNLDYHEAKEKLFENQNKEMESFEKVRSHWRDVMIARHKEELAPIANRKCVIDIRKSKKNKIDSTKSHPTTTGCVSKIINEIGLDFEALLPPLMEPNDEKIIEKSKKDKILRNKQTENIKKTIKIKDEIKENNNKRNQESSNLSTHASIIRNTQDSIFQTQDAIGKFIDSDSYSSDFDDIDKNREIKNSMNENDKIESDDKFNMLINKTNENVEPNEKKDSIVPRISIHSAQKLLSNQVENNYNQKISDEINSYNYSDDENDGLVHFTNQPNQIQIENKNLIDKKDDINIVPYSNKNSTEKDDDLILGKALPNDENEYSSYYYYESN
ncbi:hypothetical protein M9Y10_044113 [Tritrichomonas musculus]|uniref:Uncharacterized protein n=1 Tax=Tritrichomonas musculus TaxID=1915356 RepID=A0ABR2K1I5_9EUKA